MLSNLNQLHLTCGLCILGLLKENWTDKDIEELQMKIICRCLNSRNFHTREKYLHILFIFYPEMKKQGQR